MELIDLIYRNKGLADFLQNFSLNCSDYLALNRDHALNDIDFMKLNFCRYTKRTMYYAENFLKNLTKIEDDLLIRQFKQDENFMTGVSDDIYFDFDAFIFSCKSIVEGKIIERSRKLHPLVLKDFNKYAKTTFKRFIESYLNPIRDEIVHLNNYGSAIGSWIWVENKRIRIKAFDYSDDMELQKVFETVLIEMTAIIKNVAQFIMLHDCHTWGFPTKDIIFKSYDNEYRISEFIKMPSR